MGFITCVPPNVLPLFNALSSDNYSEEVPLITLFIRVEKSLSSSRIGFRPPNSVRFLSDPPVNGEMGYV